MAPPLVPPKLRAARQTQRQVVDLQLITRLQLARVCVSVRLIAASVSQRSRPPLVTPIQKPKTCAPPFCPDKSLRSNAQHDTLIVVRLSDSARARHSLFRRRTSSLTNQTHSPIAWQQRQTVAKRHYFAASRLKTTSSQWRSSSPARAFRRRCAAVSRLQRDALHPPAHRAPAGALRGSRTSRWRRATRSWA